MLSATCQRTAFFCTLNLAITASFRLGRIWFKEHGQISLDGWSHGGQAESGVPFKTGKGVSGSFVGYLLCTHRHTFT